MKFNERKTEAVIKRLKDLYISLDICERKRQFKTPSELASEFDLTASRIRQLVDEGKIGAVKVAGRIYIHKSSAVKQMIIEY
jgi:hypothetical protein